MWSQLKKEMEKIARSKSSPVIVTRMSPEDIKKIYKHKEDIDLPSRSLDNIFEDILEDKPVKKDDSIKVRKTKHVEKRHMTPEEREKYSHPGQYGRKHDPMEGEFDKDKFMDFATHLENQKELDKEYKSDWKNKKKFPMGIKDDD